MDGITPKHFFLRAALVPHDLVRKIRGRCIEVDIGEPYDKVGNAGEIAG